MPTGKPSAERGFWNTAQIIKKSTEQTFLFLNFAFLFVSAGLFQSSTMIHACIYSNIVFAWPSVCNRNKSLYVCEAILPGPLPF